MNADGSGVVRLTDARAGGPAAGLVTGRCTDRVHEHPHRERRHLHDERQRHRSRRGARPRLGSTPSRRGTATTIAFSTNRHGTLNFEIYTMPADGTGQTRLTNQAGQDVTPAWSSDGSKIAFASNRPPGHGLELRHLHDERGRQRRGTGRDPSRRRRLPRLVVLSLKTGPLGVLLGVCVGRGTPRRRCARRGVLALRAAIVAPLETHTKPRRTGNLHWRVSRGGSLVTARGGRRDSEAGVWAPMRRRNLPPGVDSQTCVR